jgi:hypothetical protein
MQEQNPVDDLFRRELADYKVTPSPELRNAFIRSAGEVIAKRSAIRWWIVGVGAGLMLTAGIGLLLLKEKPVAKPVTLSSENIEVKTNRKIDNRKIDKSISESERKFNNEVREKSVIPNKTVKTSYPKTDLNVRKSNVKTKSNAGKSSGVNQLNVDKSNGITQLNAVKSNTKTQLNAGKKDGINQLDVDKSSGTIQPNIIKSDASIQVNNKLKVSGEANDQNNIRQNVSVAEPKEQTQVAATVQNITTAVVKDTSVMPSAGPGQDVEPALQGDEKTRESQEKNKLIKTWMFDAGISYTPEWMFNTFNGDKFVNNMAVEGTIHYGQFSLRTGAGLSVTEGSDEINVKTNPYLGTYDQLDSIVFRWNEKHDKLVPVIYTTVSNVYDTSTKNNYTYSKKRYTYLQVPLILGYDLWQNRWMSIGVRAGAVMSVLLHTENISSTYESGQDRILSIDNVTPGRIQMNWQETGGIDVAFRLSRRFSFELEPDVKYYFNSIYESSPLIKKQWSIGVRTAFLVIL